MYCILSDIENVQLSQDDWVLGNIQQYGFYRVNYEDSNWRALIQQLKTNHKVCNNKIHHTWTNLLVYLLVQ